jgi:hypothetical protein
MTKKAIVLGCSHAAGAEMYPRHIENWVERGYRESYPVLIAEEFGYQVENHSIYGGSNDAIFRIFTEILPRLTDQDLVVCCWTGMDRSEIYHDDHQDWIQFNGNTSWLQQRKRTSEIPQGFLIKPLVEHHDEYFSYVESWKRFAVDKNFLSTKNNQYKNILAVNCLAGKKDVRVWNFFSLTPSDPEMFADLSSFQWPLGTIDFWTWARKQGFERVGHGHFQKDAHEKYASLAIESLRSKS